MATIEQKITPLLWFANEAEEAANFYVGLFEDSRIDKISRYGESGPGKKGDAMMVEFTLAGQEFMGLNGTAVGDASSDPTPPRGGIALFVTCDTQGELDTLWDKLAAGGEIIQCGWLKDRYGFAWNLVPKGTTDYLHGEDEEGSERAMRAMLQMKKLDLDALRRAYEGS